VAQKSAAERLLKTPAKSASAGVCLALALAALLLVGCGGGSSDHEGSSSSSSASSSLSPTGASGAQGQGAPVPGDGEKAAATKAGGGASSDPTASANSGSPQGQGQGQKHGPRIAQPKGPVEQVPSPAQVSEATVADISLQSPAIIAGAGSPGRLAATYTCDGKDSWPTLRWSEVPAGTAELALFVMNVQPVQEQLFVDWALAGIDPDLSEIEAGELPRGAVVGTNGFGKRGYEICPPGGGEIYMFALYALPQKLSPSKGFDARELRKEILATSGNVGLLPAVYERG
jgi:phosphatidylethanolamine-binding protein (PEBP) family uncharacterized protein